jgi:transposase InsO family protein
MDRIQTTCQVQHNQGSRVHPRHHALFGMPNRIITNLGSPFTAIEFRSWAQDRGISINYASVSHPEANGQVERANGFILAGLKPKLYEELEDYGSKWIEELPKVVWGLRTQVSKAIGYSPFFLVYGSEVVLPADLIWTSPRIEQHERGQSQCYSIIHSLSPRLEAPLRQKHPTLYPSSWRFGTSPHSENKWTT